MQPRELLKPTERGNCLPLTVLGAHDIKNCPSFWKCGGSGGGSMRDRRLSISQQLGLQPRFILHWNASWQDI
jgi:hypothetical protein